MVASFSMFSPRQRADAQKAPASFRSGPVRQAVRGQRDSISEKSNVFSDRELELSIIHPYRDLLLFGDITFLLPHQLFGHALSEVLTNKQDRDTDSPHVKARAHQLLPGGGIPQVLLLHIFCEANQCSGQYGRLKGRLHGASHSRSAAFLCGVYMFLHVLPVFSLTLGTIASSHSHKGILKGFHYILSDGK